MIDQTRVIVNAASASVGFHYGRGAKKATYEYNELLIPIGTGVLIGSLPSFLGFGIISSGMAGFLEGIATSKKSES